MNRLGVILLCVLLVYGCEWTGEFSGEVRDGVTKMPLCYAKIPYGEDLETYSDELGYFYFTRENRGAEDFEVIHPGYQQQVFEVEDGEHKLVLVTPQAAGIVKYVEMGDSNFSSCIRRSDKCFSDVQSLICDNQSIQSIQGVENLSSLTSLSLVGNNVIDLSALIDHQSLVTIDISGNNNVTCDQLNQLINAKGIANVTPSISNVGVNCQ